MPQNNNERLSDTMARKRPAETPLARGGSGGVDDPIKSDAVGDFKREFIKSLKSPEEIEREEVFKDEEVTARHCPNERVLVQALQNGDSPVGGLTAVFIDANGRTMDVIVAIKLVSEFAMLSWCE